MEDVGGGCLTLEAVQEFIGGRLVGVAADQVEEHMDGCGACRALVAALARDGSRATQDLGRSPTVVAGGEGGGVLAALDVVAAARSGGHPASGTRIGRYVVERPLGAGGMGTVSLADDPELRRKVCLKLVRPELLASGDPRETRARLVREAQAMAQISHPNVVAVFDIGTYGDQVFVAMECIEGGDLARWLRADRRRPREVLDVFRAAGRGLAAAHGAGLIHRDFKPQNVLLGTDGSVKVTDFGLARTGAAEDESGKPDSQAGAETAAPHSDASSPADEPASGSGESRTLHGPLTPHGAAVGTPAYMAPEQVGGGAVDARCDQFAFAVALYEALFGQRPFSGATLGEIHAAAAEGRVRPMPRRAGVSRRVRAAILRGLRGRPEQRFATIQALLAELAPRTWRRAAIAAAAALVAGGALATLNPWTADDRAALCERGPDLVAAVWNDGSRQRIQAGFAATRLELAANTSALVVRQFDDYASKWAAAHRQACVATRVRGVQDEEMLALRMACLEGRRAELAAMVQIMERPDAKLIEAAYELPARLGAIADCEDDRTLAAPVALPRDPAQREQIAEVRARLARAEAFLDAQRPDPAREAAGPAIETATRIGWAPLVAEARLHAARVDLELARFDEADEGFRAAALVAEKAGHDGVRVDAYLGLVQAQRERGQLDDALRWAEFARAAIERTGSRKLCSLSRELAKIYGKKGDNRQAIAECVRATELCTREKGARSREMGSIHLELGRFYGRTGQLAKAATELEQASAIGRAMGGEDDPLAMLALMHLTNIRRAQGRAGEALPMMERALAGIRRVYGDDHVNTAAGYMALGLTQAMVGQADAALASQERALEMTRRHMGHDDQGVAVALSAIAKTLVFAKRFADAIPRLEEAIAIETRAAGETPESIQDRALLGSLLSRARRHREAIAQYERALAGTERILGPSSPKLASALTGLGAAHRASGQPARALPLLERALRIVESGDAGPNDAARTKLQLAMALGDARKDRARAVRLAEEALAQARSVSNQMLIDQAERWLARARRRRGK